MSMAEVIIADGKWINGEDVCFSHIFVVSLRTP